MVESEWIGASLKSAPKPEEIDISLYADWSYLDLQSSLSFDRNSSSTRIEARREVRIMAGAPVRDMFCFVQAVRGLLLFGLFAIPNLSFVIRSGGGDFQQEERDAGEYQVSFLSLTPT
jgi:hypothetical protein